MSTTWVFLGIIGGREIAVSLIRRKVGKTHKVKAIKMVAKDFGYAMIGLLISIALASGANKGVRSEIWNYITNIFQ